MLSFVLNTNHYHDKTAWKINVAETRTTEHLHQCGPDLAKPTSSQQQMHKKVHNQSSWSFKSQVSRSHTVNKSHEAIQQCSESMMTSFMGWCENHFVSHYFTDDFSHLGLIDRS